MNKFHDKVDYFIDKSKRTAIDFGATTKKGLQLYGVVALCFTVLLVTLVFHISNTYMPKQEVEITETNYSQTTPQGLYLTQDEKLALPVDEKLAVPDDKK